MTERERRTAQRRLAKQIRSGTYKQSGIGAKARRIANDKEILVNRVLDIKRAAFGPNSPVVTGKRRGKWNEGRARKNIQVDPETGELHTTAEIREYLTWITQWDRAGRPDDFHGITGFDPLEQDYENPFYYH